MKILFRKFFVSTTLVAPTLLGTTDVFAMDDKFSPEKKTLSLQSNNNAPQKISGPIKEVNEAVVDSITALT